MFTAHLCLHLYEVSDLPEAINSPLLLLLLLLLPVFIYTVKEGGGDVYMPGSEKNMKRRGLFTSKYEEKVDLLDHICPYNSPTY